MEFVNPNKGQFARPEPEPLPEQHEEKPEPTAHIESLEARRAGLELPCDVWWCDKEATLVWHRTPADQVVARKRLKPVGKTSLRDVAYHCEGHVGPWYRHRYAALGAEAPAQVEAPVKRRTVAARPRVGLCDKATSDTPIKVRTTEDMPDWTVVASYQICATFKLGSAKVGAVLAVLRDAAIASNSEAA
jgi:hypothetical protein